MGGPEGLEGDLRGLIGTYRGQLERMGVKG